MPIKLIRPTQATVETLLQLIAADETADPALLVTPTSGNFVSPEEKMAELNIAASTSGVSAATTAANTALVARVTAFANALVPGALGEGVEGLAIETEIETGLTAAGINPGAVAIEGEVTMSQALFFSLYLGVLELTRARAIITPCLVANSK